MKKIHSFRSFASLIIASLVVTLAPHARAADPTPASRVKVVDGIVQPREPLAQAIDDAMQFLRKADGGYVPGKTDGPLAGYFTSAYVNEDGSQTDRPVAFPARQHAYFISTFLRYHAYTGEREWLLRARDLADWNLSHSTPSDAFYPNVPYSTYSRGKPGGSRDVDSIEPDKSAFLANAYLAVYEATGDKKYLKGAIAVADTLARRQRDDGSWPFRVVPETGNIRQEFGGAPVFFVEFFENISRYENKREYRKAYDKALGLMIDRNIKKNLWGTYHEDIVLKPEDYLSAEPICFTADYLFRRAKDHPKYIEYGRSILGPMEKRLVHTSGHAAAPAPAVSEQAGFEHLMPGHTARYCIALAHLYAVTGDKDAKRTAQSGFNAVTYMQSDAGLFRTYFHSVKEKNRDKPRPNWYSQHLYTVCHLLEAMPVLSDFVPENENHLLGSSVFVRDVRYGSGHVAFETIAPASTVLKLNFEPKTVSIGKQQLKKARELSKKGDTWFFDSSSGLLTINHDAGVVEVR